MRIRIANLNKLLRFFRLDPFVVDTQNIKDLILLLVISVIHFASLQISLVYRESSSSPRRRRWWKFGNFLTDLILPQNLIKLLTLWKLLFQFFMQLVFVFLDRFEEMDLELTFAIKLMLAHDWLKLLLVGKPAIGNVSYPAQLSRLVVVIYALKIKFGLLQLCAHWSWCLSHWLFIHGSKSTAHLLQNILILNKHISILELRSLLFNHLLKLLFILLDLDLLVEHINDSIFAKKVLWAVCFMLLLKDLDGISWRLITLVLQRLFTAVS